MPGGPRGWDGAAGAGAGAFAAAVEDDPTAEADEELEDAAVAGALDVVAAAAGMVRLIVSGAAIE